MRPPSPPRRLHGPALVLVALAGLIACGGGDDDPEPEALVCGMVDRALVERVVESGAIGTRGPGARTAEEREAEPSNCSVQDDERGRTVMQLSIGEVDVTATAQTLRTEQEGDDACGTTYTGAAGEPGEGYGCRYDRGVYVNGASVNVVENGRLVRVFVYQWTDASPEERLELAEEIARNLEENLTAGG